MAEKITRREVIKRAAYIAPAILTLTAVPAFAKGGSGYHSRSNSWSNSYSRKDWKKDGDKDWLKKLFSWLKH